jgi:hypothetical protein
MIRKMPLAIPLPLPVDAVHRPPHDLVIRFGNTWARSFAMFSSRIFSRGSPVITANSQVGVHGGRRRPAASRTF